MKREDLKKLGLTDDAVIDAIMEAHGKDITKLQTSADASKTELDGLKNQLADANKQIEDFKGMNVDEIKKTADEYKAKFEQAQTDAQTQLNNLKFDHALESALSGAKAKNVKAVQALLSTKDLKLTDDGKILGLDDQLKTIKEQNDYLFTDEQPVPRVVTGGNNQPILGDAAVNAARQAAGLPINK